MDTNSILLTVIGIVIVLYLYLKWKFLYWKNKRIYNPTPSLFMGNLTGLGYKRHGADIMLELYEQCKGKGALCGIYLFIEPTAFITDPELIKNILVREFDTFPNRGFYYNERDDPLSAHLFALENNEWKELRTKLSPTFTSGKMKLMFDIVLNIGIEMQTHLKPIAMCGDKVDVKDLIARYTTDVIGSCAFGIECNSIKNPEAEFRRYGREFFDPPVRQMYRIFFGQAFPNLARFLGICFVPKHISKFFINVVEQTMKFRKSQSSNRKDFMQLLVELEELEKDSKTISAVRIAAQAFLFFIAGFETVSSLLTFALYELAKNPDVQEKLRLHIREILQKYHGNITYEAIGEMTYLDQVLNEALRKYPPADILIRIANRDYEVPNTNHVIKKGEKLIIPIYGIHYDPDIFPNPKEFDPERFTDENKEKRHPFTFVPFGEGPRICLGQRFAVMQFRLGIIPILLKYRVVQCDDTPKTIVLKRNTPVLSSEKPIYLKFENIE